MTSEHWHRNDNRQVRLASRVDHGNRCHKSVCDQDPIDKTRLPTAVAPEIESLRNHSLLLVIAASGEVLIILDRLVADARLTSVPSIVLENFAMARRRCVGHSAIDASRRILFWVESGAWRIAS
jgi:hypothetical protein